MPLTISRASAEAAQSPSHSQNQSTNSSIPQALHTISQMHLQSPAGLKGYFEEVANLDCKFMIFSLLSGRELALCQRVCRSWRDVIQGVRLFRQKIMVDRSRLLTADWEVLRVAASVEATYDPTKAVAHLQKFRRSFIAARDVFNLAKIAEIERMSDPKRALTTLRRAARFARHDAAHARAAKLIEIARVAIVFNPKYALSILNKAQEALSLTPTLPDNTVILLLEMVRIAGLEDRKFTRERLLDIRRLILSSSRDLRIEEKLDQIEELLNTIKMAATIDREFARETVLFADEVMRSLYSMPPDPYSGRELPNRRAALLLELFKLATHLHQILPFTTLQRTKEAFLSIRSPYFRTLGLLTFVQAIRVVDSNLARVAMEEAKTILQSPHFILQKVRRACEFFNRGPKEEKKITDPQMQFEACNQFIETVAIDAPNLAEEVALSLKNPLQRINALFQCAKMEAVHHPQRVLSQLHIAKREITTLQEPFVQAEWLIDMASAAEPLDPSFARACLEEAQELLLQDFFLSHRQRQIALLTKLIDVAKEMAPDLARNLVPLTTKKVSFLQGNKFWEWIELAKVVNYLDARTAHALLSRAEKEVYHMDHLLKYVQVAATIDLSIPNRVAQSITNPMDRRRVLDLFNEYLTKRLQEK